MHRRFGFTLIEVLVVISILGILVSISTYAWGSFAARGRDNTRKTDLARLKNTLEQYATDTRSYPTYDTAQGLSRIYSAEWQLADSSICPHGDVNKRLAPNFITAIPSDPRGKFNFTNCNQIPDQRSVYLYLSSPAANGGPAESSSATGYALLATLEQKADQTPANQNPTISPCALKFTFYCTNLPGSYFDANYVITGGSSR